MFQPQPVIIERSKQKFHVLEAVSANNQFADAQIPQHPWMAPNNFGSPHQDSWCSESVSLSGPTGKKLELTLQRNPYGYTPNMVCNSANQMIGVSFDYTDQAFNVVMFDAECNIISATCAGKRDWQNKTFGGGYFYLDHKDNTIVVQDNTIISYPTQEQERRSTVYPLTPNWTSTDIVSLVTDADNSLYSALPVWDNDNPHLYWCLIAGAYDYNDFPNAPLTSPAYMAVVEVTPAAEGECVTELRGKFELPGQWNNNTFAVDEKGAYIVTNGVDASGASGPSYLWAFEYKDGRVSARWAYEYQNAGYLKPGQKNIGSGTTPTLTVAEDGTELIAITDNADPQLHVLVCRRDNGDIVAEVPCFEKMRSADEASLIGVGSTFIAENNFAHYPTWPFSQTVPNGTGMSSLTVDASGNNQALETNWDMPDTHFYAMNMLCRKSGIIFAHTCDWSSPESAEQGGMYYVSAIDSFNGRIIWQIPLGRGVEYCHEYGGIYFNHQGDLYIGTNQYIARISNVKDHQEKSTACGD